MFAGKVSSLCCDLQDLAVTLVIALAVIVVSIFAMTTCNYPVLTNDVLGVGIAGSSVTDQISPSVFLFRKVY